MWLCRKAFGIFGYTKLLIKKFPTLSFYFVFTCFLYHDTFKVLEYLMYMHWKGLKKHCFQNFNEGTGQGRAFYTENDGSTFSRKPVFSCKKFSPFLSENWSFLMTNLRCHFSSI